MCVLEGGIRIAGSFTLWLRSHKIHLVGQLRKRIGNLDTFNIF